MLDSECLTAVETQPNLLVPWILMASYLYYWRDTPILSDGVYDKITQDLRNKWNTINHRHKHLCEKLLENNTSSLFHLKEDDYPSITRGAACKVANIIY